MAKTVRVAIVGSREYPDEAAVRAFVRSLPMGTTVVSGGARGVDRWAENEARKGHYRVMVFRPDWAANGRAAGFLRNKTIVDNADEVVAFWDGKSRGTMDTVARARAAGKPVRVLQPEPIEKGDTDV